MPQSTYTSETDPSGALLEDLSAVLYTNFDLDFIPDYGSVYMARDKYNRNVSEFLFPYRGVGSLEWPGVLAVDVSNVLYVSNRSLANYISSVSDDGNINNVYFLGNQDIGGMIFDSSNILWATSVSSNINWEEQSVPFPVEYTSKIIKINIATVSQEEFVVSGVSFNKLAGIVFDSAGNIFVSDTLANTIFKITPNSDYTSGVGEIFASSQSGLNLPIGLTIDPFDNLYVVNSGNAQIFRYTPTGTSNFFVNPAILFGPTGITYNSTNNCVYVCDYGGAQNTNFRIFVVQLVSNNTADPQTGQPYELPVPIPPLVDGIQYYDQYFSIITDLNGDLFTCGAYNKPLVFILQGLGAFIKKITYTNTIEDFGGILDGGSIFFNFNIDIKYNINPIMDVALDATETYLYMAGYTSPFTGSPTDPLYPVYTGGVIYKTLLTDPSHVPIIVYPGMDIIVAPSCVAVHPITGNIYVGSNRIPEPPSSEFTTSTTFNKIVVIDATTGYTSYVNITGVQPFQPGGLAFDTLGNLYVTSDSSSFITAEWGLSYYAVIKLVFSDFQTAVSTNFVLSDQYAENLNSLVLDNNNTGFMYTSGLWAISRIELATGTITPINTTQDWSGGPQNLAIKPTTNTPYYTSFDQSGFWPNQIITPFIGYLDGAGAAQRVTLTGWMADAANNVAFITNLAFDSPTTAYSWVQTQVNVPAAFPITSFQFIRFTFTGLGNADSVLVSTSGAVPPPQSTEFFVTPGKAIFDSTGTNFIFAIADEPNGVMVKNVVKATGVVTNKGGPGAQVTLETPSSIVFSPAGNLYVSQSYSGNILMIDVQTGIGKDVSYTFTAPVTGFNSLENPTGMLYHPNGKLYLVSFSANYLVEFTFTTTTNMTGVPILFTGPQLNKPTYIAIGNNLGSNTNTLYITNSGSNEIIALNISTNTSEIYTDSANSSFQMSNPGGVVFDNQTSQLFITSTGNSSLASVGNINLVSQEIIEDAPGVILENPQGIIIDSAYNLYIANYGSDNSAVVKVTRNWISNNIFNSLNDGISRPRQNDCDPDTLKLYIADEHDYIPVIDQSSGDSATFIKYGVDAVNSNILSDYTGSVCVRQTPPTSSVGPFIVVAAFFSTMDSITGISYLFASVVPDQTNPTTGNPTITRISIPSSPNPFQLFQSKFDSFTESDASLYFLSSDQGSIMMPVATVWRLDFTNDTTATATSMVINNAQQYNGQDLPLQTLAFSNNRQFMYLLPGNEEIANLPVTLAYDLKVVENYRGAGPYNATTLCTFPTYTDGRGIRPYSALTVDKAGYIYAIVRSRYYRVHPLTGQILNLYDPLVTNPPDVLWNGTYMNYLPWDNSLFLSLTRVNTTDKFFLSFKFDDMNPPFILNDPVKQLGPYSDTLYINDVSGSLLDSYTFDFSYNIYDKYIVIDPSNIPANVPTDTTIHFVMPYVTPGPTDIYVLECNGTIVSGRFCNNCTFNKSRFVAGTYPMAITFSADTGYVYTSLQNNTISRMLVTDGVVENNLVSVSDNLSQPIGLALDVSYNLYVLNAGTTNETDGTTSGGFVSLVTLENNIINVNNDLVTNIANAKSIATDIYDGGLYFYVLSGVITRPVIIRYDIGTGLNPFVIPLALGTLYNARSIMVYKPIPTEKYLYVTDTDQFDINKIMQIDLMDPLYGTTPLATGLLYPGYDMITDSAKYVYVVNKENDTISKVVIDPARGETINTWASGNTISRPVGITIDRNDNLYVANEGTGPRNSRISRISLEAFYMPSVLLPNGTCDDAEMFNVTTGQLVNVNYSSSNPTSFPMPFPGAQSKSVIGPLPANAVNVPAPPDTGGTPDTGGGGGGGGGGDGGGDG